MHACRPTPALIIKGDKSGNFNVPGTNMRSIN
jgi:hypothetical protein